MNWIDILPQVIAWLIVYMMMVRLFRIFTKEGAIKYIKDDWQERLPYRWKYNRYGGLNRMCYRILCVIYYFIKDLFILYVAVAFYAYKFALWDIWNFVFKLDQREWYKAIRRKFVGDERKGEEEEDTDAVEQNEVEYDCVEELPFCQLFDLDSETCIMVDHVEMCPDETVFIRVVNEESYTPLYKRKVRRNRVGDRFFQLNGQNYYLDDKKTQPIIIKK